MNRKQFLKSILLTLCVVVSHEIYTMRNAYNFIQTEAQAASERVRNLLTPSATTLGRTINATTVALLALSGKQFDAYMQNPRRSPEDFLTKNFSLASLIGSFALFWTPRIAAMEYLTYAINNNSIDRVRYILDTGLIMDINAQLIFGITHKPPLLLAAEHGYADIVRLLLKRGARIDIKDTDGRTIDDYAQIRPGDLPAVQARKRAVQKVILEYKLSHQYPLKSKQATQKKLRAQYEPVEAIATEAFQELHKSMYGEAELPVALDIMYIVSDYLTPEYVETIKEHPTLPIAQPIIEKKEQEKQKLD